MTPAAKRVAVLTHTQPEQTTDALRGVAAIAGETGWRLVTSREELKKHGDATAGLEVADRASRGRRPLPGARR